MSAPADATSDRAAGHENFVPVGRIVGVHGVKGWVKIYSYTKPKEEIFTYSPWYLRRDRIWEPREVVTGRVQGRGLVAELAGIEDRDTALGMRDVEIAITRAQLPPRGKGEHFVADLVGMRVINRRGAELGRVRRIMETAGANDVLVVADTEREHLIPVVPKVYVLAVDEKQGRIDVDWEPEFS
ncbi:MAG TPA: ribosome maturation factor RimM [Gammaproteobacteria bacterium]|nr:ribosome maturation factor RimM [Gammaproteobacteria bacterium]